MQQYLYGLGEMPASWSIEALKAQAIAGRVVTLLARLHAIGFPIASMRLVDDHDADDDRSMAAGNSSAARASCRGSAAASRANRGVRRMVGGPAERKRQG